MLPRDSLIERTSMLPLLPPQPLPSSGNVILNKKRSFSPLVRRDYSSRVARLNVALQEGRHQLGDSISEQVCSSSRHLCIVFVNQVHNRIPMKITTSRFSDSQFVWKKTRLNCISCVQNDTNMNSIWRSKYRLNDLLR